MQEWISVKDRLPDEFEHVLGYMPNDNPVPMVRECYRVGGAFFYPGLRDRYYTAYWMPMPEPPSASVRVESLVKKYDKEETIEGCTVQILTDTKTGECSVGWWRGTKEDMPGRVNDG